MKFHLSILILALFSFSGAVGAESLEPIRMRFPVDPSIVQKKCALAFQQLQADRLATEARENFQCLAIIKAEYLKSVEAGFMIQCANSVNMRADGTYGVFKVETEILKNSFNTEYRPLIATECATTEAKRIADYNRSNKRQDEASAGSGQVVRENCFLSNSCYSHP